MERNNTEDFASIQKNYKIPQKKIMIVFIVNVFYYTV